MTREQKEKALAFLKDMQECTYDGIEEIRTVIECLEQQPSEDCVSRQAVLDTKVLIELPDGQSFYCISPEDVEELPPVTPTRKKGKWVKVTETDFGNGYQCSECGRFILTESIDEKKLEDFPYCHCGAEMESEE